MNVRNLLTLNAVLVLLVALTTLFVPTFFLEQNGLEISQTSINQMRAYGATIIGLALVNWMLRNEPSSGAKKAFLLGTGISYLVFALVNVVNITALPELTSSTPWAILGLNLLLGLSFVYFWRREPV